MFIEYNRELLKRNIIEEEDEEQLNVKKDRTIEEERMSDVV